MDNPKYMTLSEIVELYSKAKNNKDTLKHSTQCGCFHCKKIFDPNEITEWTENGQTAKCPYCQSDSIVTKTPAYSITEEVLDVLYKYFFGIAKQK